MVGLFFTGEAALQALSNIQIGTKALEEFGIKGFANVAAHTGVGTQESIMGAGSNQKANQSIESLKYDVEQKIASERGEKTAVQLDGTEVAQNTKPRNAQFDAILSQQVTQADMDAVIDGGNKGINAKAKSTVREV